VGADVGGVGLLLGANVVGGVGLLDGAEVGTKSSNNRTILKLLLLCPHVPPLGKNSTYT
jgi:hypothetical protein